MNHGDRVIDVRALSKTYAGRAARPALRSVHFAIARGEMVVVLGPNGAGKTTLFKILATVLRPDAGDARVAGYPLARAREIRAHIGVITDPDRSFFWRLSGEDNLRFFAAAYGIRGQAFRQRLQELAQALALTNFLQQRVGRLSSGQRGRLALARAFFHHPDVLLLDEPTRSLDPTAAVDFMHLLQRYLRNHPQAAALLATHRLDAIADFTRRLLILHRGQLAADGSPEELLQRANMPDQRIDAHSLAQLYAYYTHSLEARHDQP